MRHSLSVESSDKTLFRSTRRNIRVIAGAAGMLAYSLSNCTLARAQSVTATLVGTVFDSSNAVLLQPIISLTNKGTNETRTVLGNERGDYIIPNLPPGLAPRSERRIMASYLSRRGPSHSVRFEISVLGVY